MTQQDTPCEPAGQTGKHSGIMQITLACIAVCTFLYAPGSYSFAFVVISALLLAPRTVETTIGKVSRQAALAASAIARKCKELPNTPAIRIRIGTACIILLVLAGYFEMLAWAASEAFKPEYLVFAGTTFLSLLLLRNRKYWSGQLMFLVGVRWMMTHESVTLFLNRIGVDSLTEAHDFDLQEAQFWLSTIGSIIDFKGHVAELMFCTGFTLISFYCLRRLLARSRYASRRPGVFMLTMAALLAGGGIYLTVNDSLGLFLNSSRDFLRVSDNFSTSLPPVRSDRKKMAVVVYVGESTTSMHMGLYGYPRNTTPLLEEFAQNNENLLVFKNVFSTHTHTSPSLLEAFSFGVNENESVLPIEERKRVSVVDVARSEGAVLLYSNQGTTGSYNRASSVIFRHAERVFSTDTKLLGNLETRVQRPVEHAFFDRLDLSKNDGKRLVFLHSYAGHGPYLNNIPSSFREPVDRTFEGEEAKAILGHAGAAIEQYDSAIKYIDFSVTQVLLKVKHSPEPAVLVYFSDHGEAVYAGRGHDSARFLHEMIRVPFLVYFNEAAKKSYPEKYERYLALAKEANVATLAQLSSTIIDLMGLELTASGSGKIISTPVIGEKTRHDPIVVRRTAAGGTYIDLNMDTGAAGPISSNVLIDVTDYATGVFKARSAHKQSGTKFCYHRSNSLAKAIRGGHLTDCIDLSEAAQADGAGEIYRYAAKSNLAVWIGGQNLGSREACIKLAGVLKEHGSTSNTVLVEFPAGSHKNKEALGACVRVLREREIAVAYAVSPDDAAACSNAIGSGAPPGAQSRCEDLKNDLESAFDSGMFTDVSFDYSAVRAIEQLDVARKLTWNAKAVPVRNLKQASVDRFRMISLSDSDSGTP